MNCNESYLRLEQHKSLGGYSRAVLIAMEVTLTLLMLIIKVLQI